MGSQMTDLITKFLDYLKKEKRYSSHTLSSYSTDLGQFSTFLEQSYELKEAQKATPSMVRSWLIDMMEAGTSSSSINRKLSSLKSFYKYLIIIKEIEINPMLKVSGPKKQKRLPDFVETRKMNSLFEQVEFSDDFEGKRDELILDLFYQSGMRLSELIRLKMTDFDKYSNQLKVLGKGNKVRMLPLSTSLSEKIASYLKIRSEEFPESEAYVFLTDKGEKCYPNFVYRKVSSYLSKVTTQSKKSPHVLRHSFATHMLNNGADINAIKEILGHANLSATQVYTHNTFEKLKSVYKQSHPRA